MASREGPALLQSEGPRQLFPSTFRGKFRRLRLSANVLVLMEDLVHYLPLPIDFKQREQIGEAVANPVIDF